MMMKYLFVFVLLSLVSVTTAKTTKRSMITLPKTAVGVDDIIERPYPYAFPEKRSNKDDNVNDEKVLNVSNKENNNNNAAFTRRRGNRRSTSKSDTSTTDRVPFLGGL